jgi:hypothetical protein
MRSVGAVAAGARIALTEQNTHRSIFLQPAQHSPLDAHSYRSPPRAAAEVLRMPPYRRCTGQATARRQGSATAASSSNSNHSSEALHGFIRQTHSARHMASTHKRTTTLTQLSCSSSIAPAQQPCTLLRPARHLPNTDLPATKCRAQDSTTGAAATKENREQPTAGRPTHSAKEAAQARQPATHHTTTCLYKTSAGLLHRAASPAVILP